MGVLCAHTCDWDPWALSHFLTALSPTLGTHLSQERCQVAAGHIPCMVQSSSKEACQQAGCCYDNTTEVPCYYGNTGTTSHPKHVLAWGGGVSLLPS